MSRSGSPLRSDRARSLVALWCALWLVVAVWVAYEVWQLSALSQTVAVSGRSLDEAGSALQSLGQVPVVGDTTDRFGGQIRQNAAEIVTSAEDAGHGVRRLSVLLGLTIAIVPSVPVLVLYALGQRSVLVLER